MIHAGTDGNIERHKIPEFLKIDIPINFIRTIIIYNEKEIWFPEKVWYLCIQNKASCPHLGNLWPSLYVVLTPAEVWFPLESGLFSFIAFHGAKF